MNERTAALGRAIAGFADAALLLSETNRFYFTGFAASDGVLLATKDEALFFTDSRYTEAAEKKLGKAYVRDSADLYHALNAIFAEKDVRTVAVEQDRLTLAQFAELKEKLPGVAFDDSPALTRAINGLRRNKAAWEIREIAEAQRIAEAGLNHILGFIKPGRTEKEIALELEYYMLKNGADGLSFETIAVSGVNSSLPHGVPGQKKVEAGDFLTLDFGALKNGYHSDMTRTVAVGYATDEMKRIYSVVAAAQRASLGLRRGQSRPRRDKRSGLRQVLRPRHRPRRGSGDPRSAQPLAPFKMDAADRRRGDRGARDLPSRGIRRPDRRHGADHRKRLRKPDGRAEGAADSVTGRRANAVG